MKNSLPKLSLSIAVICSIFSISQACTNVPVTAQDGTIIVGRSMEFGPDLQSRIISSPRGRVFKTQLPNGKAASTWKSKYGYLLVDYFKTGNTVDGMNEKGLSFGYLYLPGMTQYQTVPKGQNKNAVPYTVFGDWVLGNFSSTAQVAQALKSKYIFAEPLTIGGQARLFPLHAIITDAQGNSIVIEFIKGKVQIYKSPTGILTNDPTYNWQLVNLKNYANLSPYSPNPITVDGYTYSSTGQGSGMVGLPGDSSPPSRFVRVTFLQQTALPVKDAASALTLSQHIMNEVDIPYGFSRGKVGTPNIPSNLDKTQWVVFKDLTHQRFYFRSYTNPTIQMIDVSKINFAPGAKQLMIPIATPIQTIPDATQQFLESKP